MQLKPITAILVLVLVVASLLVSGCTMQSSNPLAPTQNTGNNTPTASAPTQADTLLEKWVIVEKQIFYSNSSVNVTAWDVTWNNATSVTLSGAAVLVEGNQSATGILNETAMALPTTSDAANYVKAFDKTGYDLLNTINNNSFYYNATGHNPSVYKYYAHSETDLFSGARTDQSLVQIDNYIFLKMAKAWENT